MPTAKGSTAVSNNNRKSLLLKMASVNQLLLLRGAVAVVNSLMALNGTSYVGTLH